MRSPISTDVSRSTFKATLLGADLSALLQDGNQKLGGLRCGLGEVRTAINGKGYFRITPRRSSGPLNDNQNSNPVDGAGCLGDPIDRPGGVLE